MLSGFLITSILVKQKSAGGIKLRAFYLRRALRILPLYFVVVGCVFFVVPLLGLPHIPGMSLDDHFRVQLGLHVLMLPQVAKSFLSFVPYGGQLWTIGVEIMFYAVWPILISLTTKIRILLITAGAILALKLGALLLVGPGYPVTTFLAMTRFEVMILGGMSYLLWLQCNRPQECNPSTWYAEAMYRLLRSRMACLWLFAVLIAMTACVYIWRDDAVHIVAGLAFSILLIASAQGFIQMNVLEARPMQLLGDLSYGIYLWHFIAIGLVGKLYMHFHIRAVGLFPTLTFYAVSSLATLIMAAVVFVVIERPCNSWRRSGKL